MCKEEGINTEYIIGEVDQARRIEILNSFRNKEFNILINLDILSTGIDIPNINKLILARPTKSPNLASQILGRALRGPKNCLLYTSPSPRDRTRSRMPSSA